MDKLIKLLPFILFVLYGFANEGLVGHLLVCAVLFAFHNIVNPKESTCAV